MGRISIPETPIAQRELLFMRASHQFRTAFSKQYLLTSPMTKFQGLPIFLLWLILISVNLIIRPIMPIDETRYLSVAWEMWLREDFLVPYLNGETYSHKPPLLFWLMQLSWAIFGVNDISPRLISPLFALGATYLSGFVAREIWQGDENMARNTPYILLGTGFWLVFSTLTMFDMLLAFFVLLAIYGVLRLSKTLALREVLLIGFAIGGGVLSKGPVVVLHILPVALLAPWWLEKAHFRWREWYLKLVFALLIGAVVALAWAIPAGISGGEAYRNAIFLGQTSGRLVKSFAHQLPFWWYLEFLPLLLLPWLLFQPLWQGIFKLRFDDYGVRFCVAWIVPILLAFSLISGKRIHYLLPLMPAFALLFARAVNENLEIYKWKDAYSNFWFLLGFAALALALFPLVNPIFELRADLQALNPLWGAGLLLAMFGLTLFFCEETKHVIFYTCILSILVPTVFAASYFDIQRARFNTKPIAKKIAQFQQAGQRLVFVTNKYHGQFQFTGKLTQPLELVDSQNLAAWLHANPTGFVLMEANKLPDDKILYSHAYRSGELGFVSAKMLLNHPEFVP